jgi:glycosyltransferase involved in cell wall biosynthesis
MLYVIKERNVHCFFKWHCIPYKNYTLKSSVYKYEIHNNPTFFTITMNKTFLFVKFICFVFVFLFPKKHTKIGALFGNDYDFDRGRNVFQNNSFLNSLLYHNERMLYNLSNFIPKSKILAQDKQYYIMSLFSSH